MTSVFDLFKIGIGPSSSHTVGPMVAARAFRHDIERRSDIRHIRVELFGSLAWTGRGHATDRAVCLGLLGVEPQNIDRTTADRILSRLSVEKKIALGSNARAAFDPANDIEFNVETTFPRHSNAMRFSAFGTCGNAMKQEVYYSVGGGFIEKDGSQHIHSRTKWVHAYETAAELLETSRKTGLSIAAIQLENERTERSQKEVEAGLDAIRKAMFACIAEGLEAEGELPGGLRVQRRAKSLHASLLADQNRNTVRPHHAMDWVGLFAIAVNEENAAGGRVVTAPTNGAAGVIPAVLRYYRDFYPDFTVEGSREFLLTAAAIGGLIKRNASISGAEVGCQGEVGSAAAMAAAGLVAVSGGSAAQIENAAEIAMEHHLGMTCDPVGGLVQIPCIERNAVGAQKAIAAASLALHGDGTHRVTLDEVIRTMMQTGIDMKESYKETSRAGLAANVAQC